MGAALQMPNIWLLSFLEGFTPTAMLYPLRRFIVTLLI
jgi:hypothetical protein